MNNHFKYIRFLFVMISVVWFKSLSMNPDCSATQKVTLEVKPIIKIEVNGNPQPFILSDSIAGSNLLSVTDMNTTYSISTNLDNMKIIASINDPMPRGTKLMMKLNSNKAVSRGLVDVSSAETSVEIVTGIHKGYETNQTVSYVFSADPSITELPRQSRSITLTLTD